VLAVMDEQTSDMFGLQPFYRSCVNVHAMQD